MHGYRVSEVPVKLIGADESDFKLPSTILTEPKRRRAVRVSLGCQLRFGAYPQPDPNDSRTIICAVANRISRIPPVPKTAILDLFRSFVRHWVHSCTTPLVDTDIPTFPEWLDGTTYTEGRKGQLRKAFDESSHRPLNCRDFSDIGVQCFIKDEVYSSYKNARGIFARVDRFKVRVGPIFKAIERQLFKGKWFVKYVPFTERAKFIEDRIGGRFDRYCATDYTAFESHFNERLFKSCEFILYAHLVGKTSRWADFQRSLRVLVSTNVLKFKVPDQSYSVFKYKGNQGQNLGERTAPKGIRNLSMKVPARRMSGEMNTSLGNGFTNLMVFLFLQQHVGNTNYDCVVEGDDLVGGYSGVALTSEMYEDLGFRVKVEQHDSLNTASFCGMVYDPVDLISCPDPFKVIMKTGWISGKYSGALTKKKMKLLRARALSIMSQYSGTPICQEFALYLLRYTGKYWTFSGSRYELKGFSPDYTVRPVSPGSRAIVEKAYGWSIDEQLRLEQWFKDLTCLQRLNHPLLLDRITDQQSHYYHRYVTHKLHDEVFYPGGVYENVASVATTSCVIDQIINAAQARTTTKERKQESEAPSGPRRT